MLPQVAAPVVAAYCLVAAVVFGAYGTALALVGTQLHDPAAAALQPHLRDRLGLSGRRGARADDHRGVLDLD